jgi:uncharacterized protein YyaL (SSP411 family)
MGPKATGHIAPTWGGLTTFPKSRDPRGSLWASSQFYNVLYAYHKITNDSLIGQMLASDWRHTKSEFTRNEFVTCGHDSTENWASDDTAWDANYFLEAYTITNDRVALDYAQGAIQCALQRWGDGHIDQGLWYSDKRDIKSLYQAALLVPSLQLYEITKDDHRLEEARQLYAWAESHLLRGDGLYWCNYGQNGPDGAGRPNDIHTAGSVTFIGGNMAMAVAQARFYKITGDPTYLNLVDRTTGAILDHLRSPDGILIDDRDAWVDGFFAPAWGQEAIPLAKRRADAAATLDRTAGAIFTKGRTFDGFYDGDWGASPEPEHSAWTRHGSTPQQIMTSANAVAIIVAAAANGGR